MAKLLLLLAVACAALMAEEYFPEFRNYQRTPLGDSIDASTMKILNAAYEGAENKNLVSSPLGVMLLLSLYNEGTNPASKSEITQFLGGTDAKQTTESYKNLSVRLSEIDRSYLTVANKIAVSNKYSLNEEFVASARGYRSEVDTVDFSKPTEAAAFINKWAAEKTECHIKEPVSPDTISPDTAAALFNVIFFKGHWHVPFKTEDTKEKDFHISRNKVEKKPMMHLLQSLFYAENDEIGAKMIELPYKERGFRMIVVLPNEIDGLPSVLKKVAEKGLLSDVFKLSPSGRDIDLDIPKFDIKSKLDFNNILPKIGVSKIFEEGASGIVKETPVKVSKVFQEAFIEVNEEGATAGAFTGLVAIPMSYPPVIPRALKITVDRPFLYAILHEDKIIFAGTYSSLVAIPVSYPLVIPKPMKFTVDHPFLYAILHEDKIVFAGTYTQ